MTEPSSLTALIAEQLGQHEPGSREYQIRQELLTAHRRNLVRREAVLKHPDLAAELTKEPVGYQRPDQWNGFIPPAVINPGGEEPCRRAVVAPDGGIRFRFGQLGRQASGEVLNDSSRRAALAALSAEAWHREHPPEDGNCPPGKEDQP